MKEVWRKFKSPIGTMFLLVVGLGWYGNTAVADTKVGLLENDPGYAAPPDLSIPSIPFGSDEERVNLNCNYSLLSPKSNCMSNKERAAKIEELKKRATELRKYVKELERKKEKLMIDLLKSYGLLWEA